MGQLVYYFVTMVAIVVLVSLQIPTFTCDLDYINCCCPQPHKTQDFHMYWLLLALFQSGPSYLKGPDKSHYPVNSAIIIGFQGLLITVQGFAGCGFTSCHIVTGICFPLKLNQTLFYFHPECVHF